MQIPGHPQGAILANMRNINGNLSACGNPAAGACRITAMSLDGGMSFVDVKTVPALKDPSNKAGIVGYPAADPRVVRFQVNL